MPERVEGLPGTAFAADLAALVAGIDRADFGDRVLRLVGHACRLSDFGAFLVPDARAPKPVLTLFSGRLGAYRIRRNARDATAMPSYPGRIAALIEWARLGHEPFERFAPSPDDPRWPIYRRSGLIEHVSSVCLEGGRAHVVNFYRSAADGPIPDGEEAALARLLPVVTELVVLRHKLVGVDPALAAVAPGRVASLRERGRPGFAALSAREAAVLDALATGRTALAAALDMGVSGNTVRTLRARAYRKLGVTSLAQVQALLLAEAERAA